MFITNYWLLNIQPHSPQMQTNFIWSDLTAWSAAMEWCWDAWTSIYTALPTVHIQNLLPSRLLLLFNISPQSESDLKCWPIFNNYRVRLSPISKLSHEMTSYWTIICVISRAYRYFAYRTMLHLMTSNRNDKTIIEFRFRPKSKLSPRPIWRHLLRKFRYRTQPYTIIVNYSIHILYGN